MKSLIDRFLPHQRVDVSLWPATADDAVSFHSRVVDIQLPDRVLIAPPTLAEAATLRPLLVPETPLTVSFLEGANHIVTYPRLLEAWHAQPALVLSVTAQTRFEAINQRNFLRVDCDLPVEACLPEGLGAWRVRMDNLSGGGMGFISPRSFNDIPRVQLTFTLPSQQVTLSLMARVVRQKKLPKGGFYVGVAFMDIKPAQERQIVSECFRLEMALRRQ